jgi:pimeloyl-ACP methyl ester carboxylesterase
LVGTWCRTNAYQRELFESWKRLAVTAASDEEFVRSMFLWVYSRRSFQDGSIDSWIAQALAATPAQSTDAFLLTVDAIEAHDTADRLGAIDVPTLVIGGDCDLICPADVQADLAARFPRARLELLEGEAHQPFQEAPGEFDRIVLEFLDEVMAGSRTAEAEP